MEQHKNKLNIHSKEFKAVLKGLVQVGDFPKDILFNGAKRDYILLPYELQEDLSKRFKSYVNENIIYNQNQIVEFILNCEYDIGQPFDNRDILNQSSFNDTQFIDDVLYYLDNGNYEEDLNLLDNLGECSKDDKDLLNTFLHDLDLNISEDDLYKMNFEELNKKVEEFLNNCDEDILKDILEDNTFNWGLSVEDYEEDAEVYEWWLVTGWLCDKLNEQGEVNLNGNYWGRCTSGQSIELDGVIQDIFLKWWCE